MKAHYWPYHDDDLERAACGTRLGETSNITGDWSLVTCKRCYGKKDKINASVAETERHIVNQLGDMAAFMERQEGQQS